MQRIGNLKSIYSESGLSELLHIRKEDDYPERGFSSLRFKQNDFRVRAIEFWNHENGDFFRVYHSPKIVDEIKAEINLIEGTFRSAAEWSDFRGEFSDICKKLYLILSSDTTNELTKRNPVLTRNSKYEGLKLPDVDTSDIDVIGRVFDWKEIIAITEDTSEKNELKNTLSQGGVYLQRSNDGKSRYIGSAYGDGGILARWLKHLNSNGDARHLNLFVLENGYSNIVFTVLEFTDKDRALKSESRWKSTLGSKNTGPYDSFRLNNN